MIDSWSVYMSPSSSSTPSSTRSSHLSVLSSSSSISSPTSLPSPLPSPSVSTSSIGSKTHAFFGSPFGGGDSPTPHPPPNPPTRSISIRSHASTSTNSDDGYDETPKAEPNGPLRSLNADFFGPSLLPTPPPGTPAFPRSAFASRENSPRKPILPPLSRFFPSRRRYNEHDRDEAQSPPSRGFFQLDATPPPHANKDAPWLAEPYTASPVGDKNQHADSHMTADHAETLSDSSVLTTPIPKPEQSSYVTAKVNPAPEPEPVLQAAALPLAPLAPGVLIGAPSLELELVRRLGQGAFSSVWLACDVKGQLGAFELSRKTSLLRSKSERRGRARKVDGLRPKTKLDEQNDGMKRVRKEWNGDASAVVVKESNAGRLVAVKMTERSMCEKNSRTRVSFVREVEVLRHISHPSIVSYLHSFSTPSHHCLVLEYVGGGELFDLIDNAETHARLDEPLLRRMFGELCRAVGWMHGVGLVHRDIKLENILLTTSPFTSPLPAAPLIKLSDFGLSRFIDPAQPMLTTLCGSESYAAPELVTGRPYDGRETDAWACGVVLYALATRRLPFDLPMANVAHREVVVGEARMREVERRERRALLMRIAKGEYSWPDDRASDCADEQSRETRLGWATGPALAHSAGIRRVVGRLLVRDPHKRSKIIDLWEDEWMHGEGAPPPPLSPVSPDLDHKPDETPDVAQTESPLDPDGDDQFLEADDDGVLVDSHDIVPGSVAHQEH